MAQNFENFWKVKILDILILILILKTTVSKYWFWYWNWNLHFKNIDFDIDIEIFGTFDIDIGIDVEKNGGNVKDLSSVNEASASQTLSFLIDILFFSHLSFEIVSWVLSSSSLFWVCTTVHIFFNTTLDARWDLRAPREPVGQNESNDTTPRSLYIGRNFTLYDVTVSR